MKQQSHSSERGQAIVLITLAMVVLLGFTALAVDGSMVYADRRFSQNGADSSSLAGGTRIATGLEAANVSYETGWEASPPNCLGHVLNSVNAAKTSARARAVDNGFTTGEVALSAECNQTNIQAPTGGGQQTTIFVDKYVDFTSVVTHQTRTAFAHFVTGSDLVNTTTAVTRVRPKQPLAYGNAIVSLNPASCSGNQNGMTLGGMSGGGGASGIVVTDGGLWSNGCMDVDGNSDITVNNAGANYFYTNNNNNLDQIVFNPATTAKQITSPGMRLPTSTYDIPMPNCSGREFTKNQLLSMYATAKASGALHLPSNLYCVTNELRLTGNDELKFDRSTLVLYDGMTIGSGVPFEITTAQPNTGGRAVPGLIIYQPPTVNAPIYIEGDSQLTLRGTILAPAADIRIIGNSLVGAIRSQIIGWNVKVGGSGQTDVLWVEDKQIHRPATLELLK